MQPTNRLYLDDDDHCFQAAAIVVAVSGDSLACDRTCFYPGGGGQPPDQGRVRLEHGDVLEIVSAHADPGGVVWHVATTGLSPAFVGLRAHLSLDRERRLALTRPREPHLRGGAPVDLSHGEQGQDQQTAVCTVGEPLAFLLLLRV